MFYHQYPYTDAHELNLDWIIREIKDILTKMDSMEDMRQRFEQAYNELMGIYNSIISGNFPPSIVNAFNNWIRKYGVDILGSLADMVIFNITDDGYFVAYIPESWDDIVFGTTGFDDLIPGYDYGHLTLSYNI